MIRKYQASDCEQILALWARASSIAHAFLGADFLEEERQNIPKLYLPNAETWVWEAQGQVLGFVSMLGQQVGAFFVDPPHHRQGIGRALMAHVQALHGDLELEVFEKNELGKSCYQALGFEPTGSHIHEPTGFRLQHMRLGASQKVKDEPF